MGGSTSPSEHADRPTGAARFAAHDERALIEALGRAHDRGRIVLGRPRRVVEVELDTADRRLERRGARLVHEVGARGGAYRLRLPDGRVWRLGPSRPDFARDLPQGAGRAALEALAGERRLLEGTPRQVRRRPLRLLDDEGKTVVRVDIEVECDPQRDSGDPCAVLEAVRGYTREHGHLCALLDGDSTLRRLSAPPRPTATGTRVALDPKVSAAEGLARWLDLRLSNFLAQEAGLRADLDPEFNHDYRVAARRTRSLLGDLGRALPEAEVTFLREELRWLGGLTGPLRDLDVLVAQLRATQDLPPETFGGLTSILEPRRQAALTDLRAALDSPRYVELVRTWRELAQSQPPSDGPGAGSFTVLLARRLRKRARALREGMRPGFAQGPSAELHALRIQAKKLRYLLECAPGLVGEKRLTEAVAGLKRLQECLGQLNDAAVQTAALTELGRAPELPPQTMVWLGRLTERAAAREARERAALPEALAAFFDESARKGFDRLLRELEGAA